MNAARSAMTEACALTAGDAEEQQSPPLCNNILGDLARASGDLDGALELYGQALARYREMGLRFWEEVVLALTASVLFEQGDHAGSRSACDECLALGRGHKFTWATSRARLTLAYIAQCEGDDPAAVRLAGEALAQLRAIYESSGVGIALRALSQFALERRQLGEARSYLAEALHIASVDGDRMALARTLETLACVLAGEAPGTAAQMAGAASRLRRCTGTVPWPTEQERITRWLAVAREKLGVPGYDAEWALGEKLSDGEATSTARRFIEEVPPAASKNGVVPPESPLTERQREVAALVARGLTNEQIARELVISPATARAHVEHVLGRLDLHSRAQVAAWATAHGLVTTLEGDSR
jgi:DNA-binding CsgD family transcriptional regulator